MWNKIRKPPARVSQKDGIDVEVEGCYGDWQSPGDTRGKQGKKRRLGIAAGSSYNTLPVNPPKLKDVNENPNPIMSTAITQCPGCAVHQRKRSLVLCSAETPNNHFHTPTP